MQRQGEQNEGCSSLSSGPVCLREDEPVASLQEREGGQARGWSRGALG